MVTVPRSSDVLMLQHALNVEPAEDLEVRLFVNNMRPGDGDARALYVEADFEGYTPHRLAAQLWRFTSGQLAMAVYDELTWRCARTREPQPVYGYFVVGSRTRLLRWAERFEDGPYVMANLGDMVELTPTVGMESGIR
jgi:hypothetical protein